MPDTRASITPRDMRLLLKAEFPNGNSEAVFDLAAHLLKVLAHLFEGLDRIAAGTSPRDAGARRSPTRLPSALLGWSPLLPRQLETEPPA